MWCVLSFLRKDMWKSLQAWEEKHEQDSAWSWQNGSVILLPEDLLARHCETPNKNTHILLEEDIRHNSDD